MAGKRKAFCIEWSNLSDREVNGCSLHASMSDADNYEKRAIARNDGRFPSAKFKVRVSNDIWTGITAAKEARCPGIRYFRSDYIALKRAQQDEEGQRNGR